MTDVLYGINYLEYYFYWLYYKFIGLPLVIQICAIVLMACILAYFCLMLNIIYGIFNRRSEKKREHKIYEKYYDKIKEISLDTNNWKNEEISNAVAYDEKKRPKRSDLRIITQLLAEIKSEFEDTMNDINFQSIQNVFEITRFLERELQFGNKKDKIRALKVIQSINGYTSEAVLVRLLYDRHREIRNSARYAYMWLSQGDPFRFFDEDISMKLHKWDMMELHGILEHRRKAGFTTASFIKWVNTSAEEDVKIFFINEMRLYNEQENASILAKQVNTRSEKVRNEAIRTLGSLKYEEIEPKLMDMYHIQPEKIKRSIIAAISDFKTGKALDFLSHTYEEADNWATKKVILKVIYEYSDSGKKIFNMLEARADAQTEILFAHTKNPLINQM